MSECSLQVNAVDWATYCSGCGRECPAGEPMLDGIESCCGQGCTRALCFDCVQVAASLMNGPDYPQSRQEAQVIAG